MSLKQKQKPLLHAILVMGVAGCGKSSVGQAIANSTGWQFFDGDDYHPAANVKKMSTGTPLVDADRWPWLDRLNAVLRHKAAKGESSVLACSALKAVYRQRLSTGLDKQNVRFTIVHLEGSFELIEARMKRRENHFMPAALLKSQFASLETPSESLDGHKVLTLSIELPISEIQAKAQAAIAEPSLISAAADTPNRAID